MIVVDASALGALILGDHGADFAHALRQAFANDDLIAPIHWPVESMNLIVKAQRQGRIAATALAEYWSKADAVISLARIEPLKVDLRLLDLAERTGLTPRDAAYLELAERRGARVASADNAMLRECQVLGLETIAPIA